MLRRSVNAPIGVSKNTLYDYTASVEMLLSVTQ